MIIIIARLIGQLLALSLIVYIIYYFFIFPLNRIKNSKYELITKKEIEEIKIPKVLISFISAYHFLLALMLLSYTIFYYYRTLNDSATDWYMYIYVIIPSISIITFNFLRILVYAMNRQTNKSTLLKLGYIIPSYSIIAIFASILIMSGLYFNYHQKVLSLIFIPIMILEIYYIILNYRLLKRNNIKWEKIQPSANPEIKNM